ncbi:hypothetical protein ACOMHN_042308 [Nucella lapillus]
MKVHPDETKTCAGQNKNKEQRTREERAMERTRRNEACEMKMNQRKMDSTLNQCKAEVKQFAKACIMVRRRALEVQLQREMAQYGAELAGVGHAFHNERL